MSNWLLQYMIVVFCEPLIIALSMMAVCLMTPIGVMIFESIGTTYNIWVFVIVLYVFSYFMFVIAFAKDYIDFEKMLARESKNKLARESKHKGSDK